MYGALNNVLYDKFPATLHPFCNSNGISYGDKDGKQLKLSRFWGPSCDGLDIITPEPIPFIEMEEGGWVYVPNAGAYVNPGAEFNGFPIIDRNEELLDQISINTFFDVLSVRFNPEKHNNDIFKVCFKFSSGITKNITLRNDVAVISNSFEKNCNILIKTNEIELKKILIGINNPVTAIAAGNILVEEGGITNFLEFLTKFQ